MREKLQILEGKRTVFRAIFKRFGTKTGWKGELVQTCLFVDVTYRGKVITDHLWFECGKQFERLNLQAGDIVEFHARVSSYVKGYQGRREDVERNLSLDYRLSRPTGVCKVSGSEMLPLFGRME